MNYVRSNVLYLANQAGLMQDEIGKAVGVHQTTISRAITGKVDPSLGTLQALASYFRVSLDQLVNRNMAEDGVGTPSQIAGLDPDLLATAGEVAEAIAGKRVDPKTDAKLIALAYDKLVALAGKPIPAAVIVDLTHKAQEWGYGKARVS